MKITSFLFYAALVLFAGKAGAAHHEGDHPAMKAEGTRAMIVAIEGEIVAIDPETKEVTLQGPEGNQVTVVAILKNDRLICCRETFENSGIEPAL